MEINTSQELEALLLGLGYAYPPKVSAVPTGFLFWRDGKFEVTIQPPIRLNRKILIHVFRSDCPGGGFGGSGEHITRRLPLTKASLEQSINLGLKHCGYEQ